MKKTKSFTLLLLLAFLSNWAFAQVGPPPMPTKARQLNLKVYLQGLYNTTNSNMNQCLTADGITAKWGGNIVDTIYVELHDAANYNTIVYTAYSVELNQNGTANSNGKTYITIPSSYSGSYYITVRTRNHIETTSALPVSFANKITNYDFTTAATQAYFSNMKLLATGVYGLYVGDVNQDGVVDATGDIEAVTAAFSNGVLGYAITDINGDGVVDATGDIEAVTAAFSNGVVKQTP